MPLRDKEVEIYNLFLLGEEPSGIHHADMVTLKGVNVSPNLTNLSKTEANRDMFCPTDISQTKIVAFKIRKR